MKRSIWKICLITVCCVSSTLASASEIRVLLRFDHSGHHVARLIRNDAGSALRPPAGDSRTADEPESIASLIESLQPRMAMLLWRDSNGTALSSSREPDPRISSSPAHVEGHHGSRIGMHEGAWLVVGPETATGLTILLPADLSLGLGFERWDLLLDVNH